MNPNHHSSLWQTASRQELRELVRSQLQTLLKQKNFEGVKALLVPVKPVDIAEAIEGLPEAMQAIAFRFLSKDEAIEVYEYLDPSVQQALLEKFKRQDVLDIVDKMSPDDRARLFDELPAKVVRRLIEQLSPIEREATTLLLGYKPDTAGRLMTPKYVSLKENLTVARKRVVWLFILLITNTATSAVIRSQEDILEQVVALAAFIPLLIDTGGNVGAQSSTVVIRGLNTDKVHINRAFRVIRREAIAGGFLGLMLGVVVTVWAYLLHGNLAVAIAVGTSLFAIALLASVSGSALPFLFRSLGLDPALMSAPFITTAVDVLGVFIYLSLARLILQL